MNILVDSEEVDGATLMEHNAEDGSAPKSARIDYEGRGSEITHANPDSVDPSNVVERMRFAAREAAHSKPPGDCFGKGIVIYGGGVRYFANAWISISLLRELGCKLPIELWHLGEREIDSHMRGLLEPMGVTTRDPQT